MRLFLAAAVVGVLTACGPPPPAKRSTSVEEAVHPKPSLPVPILVDQTRHRPGSASVTALSPRGVWAATGGWDRTVKIWDVATGRLRQTLFIGHTVTKLLYIHEGKVLLIAGDKGNGSFVRAIAPFAEEVLFELEVGPSSINGLSISEDERLLLVEKDDAPPAVWDLKKQERLRHDRPKDEPRRIGCPLQRTVPDYLKPKEPQLIDCGSGNRQVRVDSRWRSVEFTSARSRLSEHENVVIVALSADGKTALTADDASRGSSPSTSIGVWDVQTWKRLRSLHFEEDSYSPARMSLSRDGRRVVIEPTTARNAAVGVTWDLRTGEVWEADPDWQKLPEYNEGRSRAITIDEGHNIGIVWDTASKKRLFELKGHKKWIRSVSMDRAGRFILTKSGDKTARLFRAEDGALLHVLSGQSESSQGALSPDGTYAATASADGTVRLWDVLTGALVHSFQQEGGAQLLSFSNNGRWLLAGGGEGKLWDIQSKSLLQSFAPNANFAALKFAARDSLVVGLANGILYVWDATSGALLQRLLTAGHGMLLEVAAERARETVLLTGDREITLHRLDAERNYVESVTLHRFESPSPREHPPWLPPFERLTVTSSLGLFDGEAPMFSHLIYRFGSDPLRAELFSGSEIAKDYQRPGLLDAFWKGKTLSLAGAAPKDHGATQDAKQKARTPAATKKGVCGNGTREPGESCDDGNTHRGDGCDASCRLEATEFLGDYAVRLGDGSVGCLWAPDRCGPTERYARSLGVSVQTNLPTLGFVTSDGRLIAPHVPTSLKLPIRAASKDGCVANEQGEIWCHDGKYPFFPDSPCYFPDLVPVLGPSVGHQNDWCQVNLSATHQVHDLSGSVQGGCAVVDDGEALCWGHSKTKGAPGVAARMPLGAGRKAQSVAVSNRHTCVLTVDGKVGCWGDATRGQLGYVGDGDDTDPPDDGYWEPTYKSLTPKRFLAFDAPATKIYASAQATCALLEDGALWCWGITSLLPPEEYGPDRYSSDIVKTTLPSTLPSAPVSLPPGCSLKDLKLEQSCVICAPSGVQCLRAATNDSNGGVSPTSLRWEARE